MLMRSRSSTNTLRARGDLFETEAERRGWGFRGQGGAIGNHVGVGLMDYGLRLALNKRR